MRREEYEEDSLGVRIKRFFVLIAVIAVIAVMVVIGINVSQLSKDAQALGLGLTMGCVGGLIPVGLILSGLKFILRYLDEREMRRASRMQQQPFYGQPPVIMMPYPQFPPQWNQQGQGQIIHSGPREFTVIGED